MTIKELREALDRCEKALDKEPHIYIDGDKLIVGRPENYFMIKIPVLIYVRNQSKI